VDQSGDVDGRVEALEEAYARQDSLGAELQRLNGLRIALPASLGLFLVLGMVLFGETLRSESLAPATMWWASSFLVVYAGAVATNQWIAGRRLSALRSEQREIEARLREIQHSEFPGPAF